MNQLNTNKQLMQKVILASITNVNLVHEILRNAFFLNLDSCITVQKVLTAYKKWFLKETKMPSFMLEPMGQVIYQEFQNNFIDNSFSTLPSMTNLDTTESN